MKRFIMQFLASTLAFILALGLALAWQTQHQHSIRDAAQAGIQQEIRDNNEGITSLRQALPREADNALQAIQLLRLREAGRSTHRSAMNLGLAIMSMTDANWRAAMVSGGTGAMDDALVARDANAYFEQARLAQLQSTTLDALMGLESYVGHGADLDTLTPEQARAAEIQARLLWAHLRTMQQMSEGLQEAYRVALTKS